MFNGDISGKSIADGEIQIGGNAVAEHCLVTGSMFERNVDPAPKLRI
jgi:hypothetical protein